MMHWAMLFLFLMVTWVDTLDLNLLPIKILKSDTTLDSGLMNRNDDHSLHLFGKLLHQYIVDMYAKFEHQRLSYIRHNQKN